MAAIETRSALSLKQKPQGSGVVKRQFLEELCTL